MTDAEIKDNLLQLANELTREGVGYFEKSLDRAGRELTGSLRDSIDFVVKDEVGMLSMTAEFVFKEYGRYLDMAQLRYTTWTNIDAIERFIEEVGLDKFAFVNGYKGSKVPTVEEAKKRLMWTILNYRKKIPVIRQPKNKQWYNAVKSAYINVMNRRLSARLGELVPGQMKDILEN